MKVLYLSQLDNLQTIEIDEVLIRFHRNGVSSALLKKVVEDVETQGFSIGHQALFGSFAVISLNLPENNILILSDRELEGLSSCIAMASTDGYGILDIVERKVDELMMLRKEKKEEKTAHEGLSKLRYPG